ncbi:MAG: hypothetical protein CVU61_00210 [Deltaproteobacteria bacterium HGW-Deltaproteobacteria-19]|nr:MAG: hypothetical protein CVU61_00210 [Deltaproteobacteria bacterium HGW-Deltaproteobacteria-19]
MEHNKLFSMSCILYSLHGSRDMSSRPGFFTRHHMDYADENPDHDSSDNKDDKKICHIVLQWNPLVL